MISIRNHPIVQQHAGKVAWLVVAITIVSGFEGFYPKKYYDSVGVATVCYGATAADHVDLTKVYTKAECQQMLGNDLPKYDLSVQKCLTKEAYDALPPERHAATVSLVYNVGGGAFCHSSVARDLNAGRIQQACDDFLRFNKAGGRVLKGLTNRREAERKLCRVGL